MIWGHNRDGGSCHDGISLIPTSRARYTFLLRALDSWRYAHRVRDIITRRCCYNYHYRGVLLIATHQLAICVTCLKTCILECMDTRSEIALLIFDIRDERN